ncbi:MAG: imm11 family protein [Burkholderiales bacterium]
MIFVITEKENYDHTNLNLGEFVDVRFNGGKTLKGKVPPTAFRIDDLRPPFDYLESGGKIVISSRLKELFDTAGVDAEYFEVQMVDKKNRPIGTRHFLVNPMNIVDCIDEENSMIRRSGPNNIIESISSLALRKPQTTFPPLFLPKGFQFIACVNEHLASILNTRDISNLRVTGLLNYSFP